MGITINDICNDKNNDLSTMVEICGKNPKDDYDPLTEEYYYGTLADVPEWLKKYGVKSTGWALGRQCHIIDIDYIMGEYSHGEWEKSINK